MSALTTDLNIASGATGQKNWSSPQIVKFESIDDYINLSERLLPKFQKIVDDLVADLGVEIKTGTACVKLQSSANRKMVDSTVLGSPEKIRDYLRIKLVVPNTGLASVDDLEVVKEAIKSLSITRGYKDQFAFPEPETGFRAFKAHVLVSDENASEHPIVAEILIEHAGMEKANAATATLRAVERQLRNVTSGLKGLYQDVAGPRISKSESLAREARKDIHDIAAQKAGLNRLINPESQYKLSDNVQSLRNKCNGALHGVKTAVTRALESL